MTGDRSAQGRANRRRGVTWERQVARWLQDQGLLAERTPTGRHQDVGDLHTPDLPLVWELKHTSRLELGPWLDTLALKALALRRPGVLIVKRRGHRSPGEAFAVLRLADLIHILHPTAHQPGAADHHPTPEGSTTHDPCQP